MRKQTILFYWADIKFAGFSRRFFVSKFRSINAKFVHLLNKSTDQLMPRNSRSLEGTYEGNVNRIDEMTVVGLHESERTIVFCSHLMTKFIIWIIWIQWPWPQIGLSFGGHWICTIYNHISTFPHSNKQKKILMASIACKAIPCSFKYLLLRFLYSNCYLYNIFFLHNIRRHIDIPIERRKNPFGIGSKCQANFIQSHMKVFFFFLLFTSLSFYPLYVRVLVCVTLICERMCHIHARTCRTVRYRYVPYCVVSHGTILNI